MMGFIYFTERFFNFAELMTQVIGSAYVHVQLSSMNIQRDVSCTIIIQMRLVPTNR